MVSSVSKNNYMEEISPQKTKKTLNEAQRKLLLHSFSSIYELADAVHKEYGLSKTSIYRFFKGTHWPRGENLEKICKGANVPMWQFYKLEE